MAIGWIQRIGINHEESFSMGIIWVMLAVARMYSIKQSGLP